MVGDAQELDDELLAVWQLIESGAYAEASSLPRGLLNAWPNNPDCFHLLGIASAGSRNLAGAIEHLRKAIAIAPENAEFHDNLGAFLQHAGLVDQAEFHVLE